MRAIAPDSAVPQSNPATVQIQDLSENATLANSLLEVARLLDHQHASEFRIHAYRNAAAAIAELRYPIRQVFESGGVEALVALPTIGHSIASLTEQYLRTGHILLLDRLRGDDNAERLFGMIPTLGPELSRRIHETLHIETLPELYAAACDHSLSTVPGVGRKRVQAIRDCLAEKLRGHFPPGTPKAEKSEVDYSIPIAELLSVDEQYRTAASEGKLPKIAPQRFNPGAVAWLPILHTERADRHYTAMFSNTPRAHELNTTRDWVIVYRDDRNANGRWTIITSQFGKTKGCRIVRGREAECLEHYKREARPESVADGPRAKTE